MEHLTITLAQRLKELRQNTGLTIHELKSSLKDKYGIDISIESLRNYEVVDQHHTKYGKNEGMNIKYLLCIADFYRVSTDYLLGQTDVPTADTEYQAVETFTGLSHRSIHWLHLNREEEKVQILNALMEHTDFRIALSDILELKHTAPSILQDGVFWPPPIEKRSNYVMINRETYTELLEYKITEALKRAFKDIGYSDFDLSANIGKELID